MPIVEIADRGEILRILSSSELCVASRRREFVMSDDEFGETAFNSRDFSDFRAGDAPRTFCDSRSSDNDAVTLLISSWERF